MTPQCRMRADAPTTRGKSSLFVAAMQLRMRSEMTGNGSQPSMSESAAW